MIYMKNTDLHLITKIALLYHRDGLTHEDVARRLNLSRQSVGRYLQRAKQQGIVKIQIESPLLFCTELETLLEKRFQLKEAIVVSPAVDNEEAVKEALGMACAGFLERVVQSGDILGVSWGSTVLQCARHLKPVKRENVTVVQLNGSLDVGIYSTRAEYLVDRIAHAFNARMVTLPAPMLVDRTEILESLLSDSRIAAGLDLACRANIALFGVGDVSVHSSPYKAGYFDLPLLQNLQNSDTVGEICGRFYNRNGLPSFPELQSRTLAVDLENLKQKPLSVAIAGMPYKVDAILGMLRGRLCNVLITDESTAKTLLMGFVGDGLRDVFDPMQGGRS